MRRVSLLALLAVVGLSASALSACGKDKSGTDLQSTDARIAILSPKNGDTTGSVVHVKTELRGGTLVPLTSTKLVPNGGHIHLIVDNQVQSMALGTEQDTQPLSPGRHVIAVEFVNAQHQPWKRPVLASVFVQVQ